jgi:hypothetical protein
MTQASAYMRLITAIHGAIASIFPFHCMARSTDFSSHFWRHGNRRSAFDRVMVGVIRCGHYLKVLDSIVQFIAVDVVNVLRRMKFSAKKFLHNQSMLQSVFIGDTENPIATFGSTSQAVLAPNSKRGVTVFLQFLSMLITKVLGYRAICAAFDTASCFGTGIIEAFPFHMSHIGQSKANRQVKNRKEKHEYSVSSSSS